MFSGHLPPLTGPVAAGGLNSASGNVLAADDLAATKIEKHEYKYNGSIHDKYPGLEPGDLGSGLHGADHLGRILLHK